MDVARMILESLSDSVTDNANLFSVKLKKAVEEIKARESKGEGTEELSEIDKRLIELRRAEEEGDLCWMDYPSWNAVAYDFQKIVTSNLDPLFWSGVFFRLSDFMKLEVPIMNAIGHGTSAIMVQDNKLSKRIYVFAIDSIYDHYSDRQLKAVNKELKDKVIRQYAVSNGTVVINIIEELDEENSTF